APAAAAAPDVRTKSLRLLFSFIWPPGSTPYLRASACWGAFIILSVPMKLSILVPVFNERTVVERSLAQVLAAPLPENLQRELILVDDCSTDGTSAIDRKSVV